MDQARNEDCAFILLIKEFFALKDSSGNLRQIFRIWTCKFHSSIIHDFAEETQSSRQLSTILNNTLTQNLGKCSTEEKLNTLNEESLQLSSKQIEKKQKIEYKAQDTKNDLEGLARAEMDNQLKDLENLMSMKQNQAVTNEKKWASRVHYQTWASFNHIQMYELNMAQIIVF